MNAKQTWQAALGELELELTKPIFETYLRRTTILSASENKYTLVAPSTFVKEWIEDRLLHKVEASLARVAGHAVEVKVVFNQRQRRQASAQVRPATSEEHEVRDSEQEPQSQDKKTPAGGRNDGTPLNPRYTFDSFIVGKSNQLANAAAMAVADRPGQAYNPFFIYGAVGLGKTHLLHAIGHRVLSQGKEINYVSSESFTNELITAIREHRTEEFRQRYRRAEVLLIDDIQFIAGKESTQEEFFHTFNALHEANRQIVLCSDRPPKSIATLEERLRSRFEWGLIADVQAPDFEHRIAILREKAREQGIDVISPDVLEIIARTALSSIRELEGSLNRVLALAQLQNRALTTDLVKAALSDIAVPAERQFIKPEDVLQAVANFYQVDVRALRGKQRDKDTVLPRQIAMYLMRKETEASLADIGKQLGGRDHSTVLHGCDRIANEIEVNSRLRSQLAEITQSVYTQSHT